MICLARSYARISPLDSGFLKELYVIDPDEDFLALSNSLALDFSVVNPEDFDFDPVERRYDPEGNLISDFGKKKNQKKR